MNVSLPTSTPTPYPSSTNIWNTRHHPLWSTYSAASTVIANFPKPWRSSFSMTLTSANPALKSHNFRVRPCLLFRHPQLPTLRSHSTSCITPSTADIITCLLFWILVTNYTSFYDLQQHGWDLFHALHQPLDFHLRRARIYRCRSWHEPYRSTYGGEISSLSITAMSDTNQGTLEAFRNEQSHKFIRSAVHKIVSNTPTIHSTTLLGKIEMSWNFIQHASREILHLHRFFTAPHILQHVPNTTLHQLIALQDVLRVETDQLHETNLVTRASNPYHRYDKTLPTFTTNQYVRFQRRNHNWRKGIAQSLEIPMIHVRLVNFIYPKHQKLILPYLEDYATPPEVLCKDDDEITLPDYDVEIPQLSSFLLANNTAPRRDTSNVSTPS